MTSSTDSDLATPGMGVLSAQEVARVAAPLASAFTLPPAAYIEPAVFESEQTRILRRSWMPLARVEQLPNAGDYIALTLLDQPLVVVRGRDQEIRVMSRVCLHRAAPIVEGSGNSNVFTCPYHAWSYATDGVLVRAPLMDGAAAFEPAACRLPQFRTEIWNGFVLVNLDDEAAAFAPQVAEFSDHFAAFRLDEMTLVETLEFDSPWNWKVLVENFMEAYHHIAIHSRTFEPVFHAEDSRVPEVAGPCSILHMPRTPAVAADGDLPMVEGLSSAEQRDLYATVLFPCFLLGIQGNSLAWYQVLPISHDRLLLKIHMCVPPATAELPLLDEIREGLRHAVTAIHEEDIRANDLVWAGLHAPATVQGRLAPLEKSIWAFNQWWLGQLGLAPATAGP